MSIVSLADEQNRLLAFVERGLAASGGRFVWLGVDGAPDLSRPLGLYAVARLVHCFSVETLLGRAGAREIAERAVDDLLLNFADAVYGGFRADARAGGSDRKELYGHAFALLAGASARQAGVRGAETLYAAARDAIDTRFFVEADGAALESWDRAFTEPEDYRGQNGNMHLAEALLAAYEVSGDPVLLDRAERIAERIVRDEAAAHDWRVPEHFTSRWVVDPLYNADAPNDPFRPAGTIPGHALEWARLVLWLRARRPTASWALDAAVRLFDTAVADAWGEGGGGFAYTVDFSGAVINPARMHWTVAEGVGAAVALHRATGDNGYGRWTDRFWGYIGARVIDRDGGSWWHELDAAGAPAFGTWDGKPDLYHAWQATLYARVDGDMGLAEAAARSLVRDVPVPVPALPAESNGSGEVEG
jgi:sulfoquinovose isomerase